MAKKFIFFFVSVAILFSCSLNTKAKRDFRLGRYESAIEQYKKFLTRNPEKIPLVLHSIAESYRLSNRSKESLLYYKKAIDEGVHNDSIYLFYSLSLKVAGSYQKAKEILTGSLSKISDQKYKKLTEKEIQNITYLQEIMDKKSYYNVRNLKSINTKFPEYSPVYNDGKLFFTSAREQDNKIYLSTGTPFTDIYQVNTKGAIVDTKSIESIGNEINLPDINEGTITISPDGKTMVFARGNSGKKKSTADVNLYFSVLRNGRWTKPKMLNISDPRYWDSCPSFSQNGKMLYFASNRPNGYGGIDLYSVKRTSLGRFIDVKNLGNQINTSGNEMFPHISDDGHLYFSSSGHPGFGGLDLFVARKVNGKIEIENLGKPLNSNADDFGMFFYKADRGFFSSNREGGSGDDDIYTFLNTDPKLKIVNYYLDGVTFTKNSKDSINVLPYVDVKLLDYNDSIIDETTSDNEGKFSFRVYEHEHYILLAKKETEKEKYFVTRKPFSTVGKAADRDTLKQLVTNIRFETDIILERIEKDKVFVLENIYYDLDKYDITDLAALELDKLVSILKDNPLIKIELSSHTDDRQTELYNQRLSERRAQAAVEYVASQGIDKSRMISRGYGESRLIIKNAKTEEEHQVNRRTEFKIIDEGRSKDEYFIEDQYFENDVNNSENDDK